MERELRITMRYNNLYKYDVHVNCDCVNITGSCILQGGYAIALLKEMSTFLKFKVIQMTSIDGYNFANATSEGIDLFVGSYVLREGRTKLVDPTFVIGFSKLVAFLNNEHESTSQNILFHPFKLNLWMSILGVIILSLITIGLIHKASVRLYRCSILNLINTADVMFGGIAISLQKGTLPLPLLCFSTRVALSSISFCFLCSFFYYSGAIVAILAIAKSGITSLDALVSSNYEILLDKGYNNGSSSQLILEKLRANDNIVDKLLHKASETHIRFDTFETSIKEVQRKQVALVTENDSGLGAINSVIGQLPCSWKQIPIKGIWYQTTMYMKKGMMYKHEINSMFLKMSERGIMNYLKNKWIPQDTFCLQKKDTRQVVTLSNLSIGFYIIGLGIISSILITILEKLFCLIYK